MKTEKQQRMAAYGFSTKMTESECVAELFKVYSENIASKQLYFQIKIVSLHT